MNNKIDIKSFVLGAILGAVVVFSFWAATSSVNKSWRYVILEGKVSQSATHSRLSGFINANLDSGMELVSVSPVFNKRDDDGWAFALLRIKN